MTGLLAIALLLPCLLAAAFLLGRYMRGRRPGEPGLSPVTRQHLELVQGGRLNQASVDAAKRRFQEWLARGEVGRVESSLRAGTQYVEKVRALTEIGSEEACRILERQLKRRLCDDQIEQAWYWIDVAHSLRSLNRNESLPAILERVQNGEEFPLVQYFAAETVCFIGFGSYARQLDTAAGEQALRILHYALEGLRFGVPPQLLVEARLGEVLETIWDNRPAGTHPLLVRVFAETQRFLRRAHHAEQIYAEDPADFESFSLQLARIQGLEGYMQDYLASASPRLREMLAVAEPRRQRDILQAMADLRMETAEVVLPLLDDAAFAHAEAAILVLRWSRDSRVGPYLRGYAEARVPHSRRVGRKLRVRPPHRPSLPPSVPWRAILFSLRGHESAETEQYLLHAARDWDPIYRSTAVGSLGWWEPHDRAAVLEQLNQSRFDPSPMVRQAARASLARLGERQALQWFRLALTSENRPRILEAIQFIAVENLTLLWPDLDRLADSDDFDVAYHAREALEQLREELDARRRIPE